MPDEGRLAQLRAEFARLDALDGYDAQGRGRRFNQFIAELLQCWGVDTKVNDNAKRPMLIMFCGLPGSGKTTIARKLERETGAVRFSTDEWMADLGVDFFDEMRENLQLRLNELWKELLGHGQSIILEDGTWKREERDTLRQVAKMLNAITEIHYFDLTFDELWRRLEIRNAIAAYETVPITKELLQECWPRFQRPDKAELALFDRSIVYR